MSSNSDVSASEGDSAKPNGDDSAFFTQLVDIDAVLQAELVKNGCGRDVIVHSHCPPFLWIERELKKIEDARDPPFRISTKGNKRSLSCNALGLVGLVKSTVDQSDLWLDFYSPRVELYKSALEKHFKDRVRFESPSDKVEGVAIWEKINKMWLEIKDAMKSQRFRRKEKSWRGELERRMEKAAKLVDKSLLKYSRILIVRLDLYMGSLDVNHLAQEYYPAVRAGHDESAELEKCLDHLMNNKKKNSRIFEHLVTQIVKLEYGPSRGFHAHTIWFFNGDEVKDPGYYANEIGKYWRDVITEGRGTYFNCHTRTFSPALDGIGMVHRFDEQKRAALMKVIAYLAKSDLHLRCKSSPKQKLIRFGLLSAIGEPRPRGRPSLATNGSQGRSISELLQR